MKNKSTFKDGIEESVIQASSKLFVPILKIFLSCGITHKDLVHLTRVLIIEAAKQLLQDQDEPVTISNISITTGISRKWVSKILKEASSPEEVKLNSSTRIETVLLGWLNDPSFEEILPLQPQLPNSFARLIESYGRDLPAKSVLQTMVNQGFARIIPNHFDIGINGVQLLHIPEGLHSDKKWIVSIVGAIVGRVLNTAFHNTMGPGSDNPRIRKVNQERWSYRIPENQTEALREELRSVLASQIKDGESLLEKYEAPSRSPNKPYRTIGIGWYEFEE